MADAALVAQQTRSWLQHAVVGLDLCPFARGPLEGGRVRIAVSEANDVEGALTDLWMELDRLLAADPAEVETTLLVLPEGLDDFEDFLDVIELSEVVLEKRGAADEVQLAHFHPDYRFEGAVEGDPADFTNRSPHPVLHLLRTAGVARAIAAHPDTLSIPDRNARLLRSLHPAALERLRRGEPPEQA